MGLSGWQPIETAPRDGTRILIASSEYFTAAKWWYNVQQDLIPAQYARSAEGSPLPTGVGLPLAGMPLGWRWVPNPQAGERVYSWWADMLIAFTDGKGRSEDEWANDFEPTHWMPLARP